MSNPWDPPPLPNTADADYHLLFHSVGSITTAWEYVEFKLARIFTVLCDAPDTWEPLRAYGEGVAYRFRVQRFRDSADAFFVRHPNQDLEGELAAILISCDGFADRRNDIVHGTVFDCSTSPELMQAFGLPAHGGEQYLLIPAAHTARKYISPGMQAPLYGYNAKMAGQLFHRIHDLQNWIDDFAVRLGNYARARALQVPR